MTPDDVDGRLTALEQSVAQLRQQQAISSADSSAARVLAAGADVDASQIRVAYLAQLKVLHALRETQLEQGERIGGLEGRVEGLDGRLEGFDGRLEGFGARLEGLDGRLEGFGARLEGLDGRLEGFGARLEGFDGRLEGFGARLEGFDGRLEGLEASTAEGFRTTQAGMAQIVALLTER